MKIHMDIHRRIDGVDRNVEAVPDPAPAPIPPAPRPAPVAPASKTPTLPDDVGEIRAKIALLPGRVKAPKKLN